MESDDTQRPSSQTRSPLRQFLYSLEEAAGDTLSDEAIVWLNDRPPESEYFESNEALANLQITKLTVPPQGETEVPTKSQDAAAQFAQFLLTFPPRASLETLAKSLGIMPLPRKESLMREILYATGGTHQMASRLDGMSVADLEDMAQDVRRTQRS